VVPSLFLGFSAQTQAPAPLRVAFTAYSYVALGLSAVLVWWTWRVFCGDPPRSPSLPGRRALLWGLAAFAAWMLLLVALNLFDFIPGGAAQLGQ
jgi:hypothetical protein